MPRMQAPTGEVADLGTVYVNAAYQNFFTPEGGGGGGGGSNGGGAGGLGEGDAWIEELGEPPVDPDGFMPTPQSCADIAYLLQDYEAKRDSYDTVRGIIEGIGDVNEVVDILQDIVSVFTLIGVAGVAARWNAAKAAFEASKGRIAARIGMASTIGIGIYATLWLSTRATQGRWDVRISALQTQAEEWNCDSD